MVAGLQARRADPTQPGNPGRLAWIDVARGLAITLVVFGHCYRGLVAARVVPAGGALGFVDDVIYGFHMPLFFFLSGLFAGRAAVPTGVFLLGRLRTIAWPYVLWMSIELLLLELFAGRTNMGHISIGLDTYLFDPISPFWFLYALLICAVFLRLVWPGGPVWAVAAAAAVFVVGQVVPVEIVGLVSWGALYYTLGAALAPIVKRDAFCRIVAKLPVIVTMATLTVLLSLVFVRQAVPYRWAVPVAVVGSLAVFGLSERLAAWSSAAVAIFGGLGQISLTILVLHILATASTRILLLGVFHVHLGWLHLVLGTGMGLMAPVAVQIVCTRLGLNALLGLPRVRWAWPSITRTGSVQL